jgi:hypothetical protein
MRKLAANLEGLSSKPKTNAYYSGPIPSLYDGKLIFRGKFRTRELDITFQQNLLHGLYLQGYFPIRRLRVKDIDYCQSVTTKVEHDALVDFVDNDLDEILEEYDIKPLKTEFSRDELADFMISAGWNGSCTFPTGMVSALRGFVQGGVIIPTAGKKDINHIFSLPLGHNKHWAFNARANAHATLWKKVILGVNAGATIFMKKTYDHRLTTSTNQSGTAAHAGYIVLEKGKATNDPGTKWDATGYIKFENIFGGFSALVGYSYTQQEKTNLTLKDDNVLKTALANGIIKNKDEVINTNQQLDQWYQHVLHGYIEFDLGVHSDKAPTLKLQLAYHLPILAKNVFATEMWSGTVGVGIDWTL